MPAPAARTQKARRTRSPLSLWIVASAAAAAALTATAAAATTEVPPVSPAHAPRLVHAGVSGSLHDSLYLAIAAQSYPTSPALSSDPLGFVPVGPDDGLSPGAAPAAGGHGDGAASRHDKRAASVIASSIAVQSAGGMNGGGTAEAVLTKPPAESISPSPTGTSIAMSSEATNASTASATATTSASLASSTEPSSNSSSGVPAEYQMPQPFDSTLGTNFSSTACPSFFATFLADPAFQACAPFSLLLTTSTAFFRAEKSPTTLLPHILNATCSAPLDSCAGVMDALAVKIKKPNTCGKDLELGNPLVAEALDGFNSYRLMRQAGCVTSNTTGQYCFATAAAESDPSNLYFYYLPEGTTLPSGTSPDCNSCSLRSGRPSRPS